MSPQHLIMALLISVIWGANFVAIKVGLHQFPPFLLSSLRFVLILAVLFPYLKIVRGQMTKVFLISIFAGALHLGATFLGLSLAHDASSVAIAVQLNVPFATLLAVIFLGERIHFWRITGIVLAFVGALLLGFDPHVFAYIDALFVIAFAALMYAIGTIMMRTVKGVGVFQLQAWLAFISAPFLIAMSLIVEPGQWQHLPEITPPTLVAILFSAFGSSVFGHGGIFYLLQRYPVAVVSPFLLLAPVFGVIMAVIFLHDTLTPQMIMGGLVTFAGISIITLRERTQTAAAPEEPLPAGGK